MTGFSFGASASEDVDQLFNEGSQHVDADGDDDSVIFSPEEPETLTPQSTVSTASAYSPESTYSPTPAPSPAYNPPQQVDDRYEDYEADQYPAPTTYQEAPSYGQHDTRNADHVASAPSPEQAEPPTPAPRRNTIPRFDEQVAYTSRIISILDAYRGLTINEKTTTGKIIYNTPDFDLQDESSLIVSILNADEMVGVTLKNLRKAANELDRVSRVFMVLKLPGDQLAALGSMVSRFFPDGVEYHFQPSNTIDYSREVEEAIDRIPKEQVSEMSSAESVINAGL